MRSKTAIVTSIFLFMIGMAMPITLSLYLSWLQAVEIERDQLFTIVRAVMQRSRICLNEVYEALDDLESDKIATCSSANIKKMQNIVFGTHCINEIQYFSNGAVQCGSSGTINSRSKIVPSGFLLPNESAISFDVSNFTKQSDNLIRFTRGNYAISINKNSLTDLMTGPYIRIALITDDGQVISALNYFNPPRKSLIDNVLTYDNLTEDDDYLLAVYSAPGLYYIVSEPMSYVIKQWYKSLTLFLPFGLFMSLVACGAVIWGLKRRLSALGELKIAVANREFIFYYQPLIDFRTGSCIGAEALIRWKKPDGTMVRPDLFIPLAESSGLIQDITDQLVESVARDLKNTLAADKNLHISINVPVIDFNSKRIFKKLEDTMANTGIKPNQIWLEITERGFIDFAQVQESLKDARKLGYLIVIDDFGTGYSSLSYLKDLDIDVLKIDKSFVDTVNTDAVTSHVTEHIINLAKELNLKIVAEGVEKIEQVDYLKARNVDFAQGWFYAKALPLDEFLAFYKKTNIGKG